MDIHSTIQDAFVVTCYFKYIWPNKQLFLILLGTDQLEMFFKSGGLGIVLLSINRIKLSGQNVYFIDNKDFNLATFSGKVLKFDKPITGDNIIWSNTYGQSIEVKGKD